MEFLENSHVYSESVIKGVIFLFKEKSMISLQSTHHIVLVLIRVKTDTTYVVKETGLYYYH